MKKLLAVLLLIPVLAFSQEERHGHVQLGGGFSLGGFNPSEVNDYMGSYFSERGYTFTAGFPELYLTLGGRLFLGYKSKIGLGLEGSLEGQTAPKVTNYFNYSLNRLTECVKLTYDIRASRFFSIIVGAGPTFNRIKLTIDGEKQFEGNSIGTKVGLAFQFNLKHVAPRIFIDYDRVIATDTNPATLSNIKMNYSGIQFGLAFSGLFY
jgi:hypothetical protein